MVKLPIKKKRILFIVLGVFALILLIIYGYLAFIDYKIIYYKDENHTQKRFSIEFRKPINPIIKFFDEFSAGVKFGMSENAGASPEDEEITPITYRYPNLDDYYGMSDYTSEYSIVEDSQKEECSAFSDDCSDKKNFRSLDTNLGYADFSVFLDKQYRANPEDYSWENWNYLTHYIYADVLEVDSEQFRLKLKVIKPDSINFTQFKDEFWVSAYCPSFASVIVYPYNYEIFKRNINVFSDVKPGEDRIFAYCRDKECTEVGNSCIVERDLQ